MIALALGPRDLARPLCSLAIAIRLDRATLAACREGELLKLANDALNLLRRVGVRFRAGFLEMAAPAKRRGIVDIAGTAELQRVDMVNLRCPLALAANAEDAAADNGAFDRGCEIPSVGNCACLAHVLNSVLFNDDIIAPLVSYVKRVRL